MITGVLLKIPDSLFPIVELFKIQARNELTFPNEILNKCYQSSTLAFPIRIHLKYKIL